MATKLLSVRMKMEGGKVVEAELIGIGAAGSKSLGQLNRAAKESGTGLNAFRFQAQNAGYQVQDFAVQVAGGTDASRALAQQLPQLLSGFGLLGVVVGTASAVLIPLAGHLFNAGDTADEAAGKVAALESAVKELNTANAAFDLSGIDALIAKYGELDAAVVLMLSRQQEAKRDAVIEAAKTAVAGLGSEIKQIEAILRSYDNFINASLSDPQWSVNALAEADALQAEFGLTTVEARELVAALDDLRRAATLDEAAASAAVLLGKIEGTALAGGDLRDTLLDVEDAAREGSNAMAAMPGILGAAWDQATGLAGQMWDAAAAAFNFGRNASNAAAIAAYDATADATGLAGPDGVRSQQMGGGRFTPRVSGAALPYVAPRAARGGARRSGGGGQSDDMREAARIYDQTRTAAEKYATELERLNELQAGGFISGDTYARAMENLRDKTGETADAMGALEQSVGEAFTSFVTGAKSGQEALKDLLSSLAETLANSAFQSIAGSLFGGGAGGGLFAGIFGGGKAGGGPVMAGRSYMVGESGPEQITMTGNGYVTNTAALRSAVSGGGGVVINVDARGAVEGVAVQIERALQAVVPSIVQASVNGTRAAAARGRA